MLFTFQTELQKATNPKNLETEVEYDVNHYVNPLIVITR